MKKKLLLVSALMASSISFGQTIFSENFDAGTTLPTGWALHDVDGLTPNNSAFTAAWIFGAVDAAHGNSAVSTSYYVPAGQADDWIVTPSIAIPGTGSYTFQFDVEALDASYPDGYIVYVSTTGQAVANFTSPAVMTVASGETTWTTKSVDLSSYAGQTIYLAVRNHSNDMDVLAIDNFRVRQLQANDALLNSVTLNRYSMTSTNNTLTASVTNDGSNAITSVTMDWNDGTSHSQTISCNIASGATATITHPTAVNYSTVVEKNIAVTITQVNGGTDPNTANNAGAAPFNTLSAASTKHVVIEEGTGTWCGYCVRGAVAMEYMHLNHPDFIGIAVHNGDPMTVTEYDAGNAATLSGFPGANVDRAVLGADVGNTQFETYYNDRKNLPIPAGMTAVASGTGSTVNIDVSTTFRTVFANANYRLAVAIVEDSVVGNASGYDQHNYYSNQQSGGSAGVLVDVHGLDYQQLPTVIPHATPLYNGTIYHFNHVARAIIGGFTGLAGSVPTTITDGQVATHTFNYTIPAGSNRDYMRAVAMLIDQVSGQVVNSVEVDLAGADAGINAIANEMNMKVYPNPATDVVNVDFKASNKNYVVTLTDLSGRTIVSNQYSNLSGAQTVAVPVNGIAPGNYLVTVSTEGAIFTQQVAVK